MDDEFILGPDADLPHELRAFVTRWDTELTDKERVFHLTLLREDETVIGSACYTYDNWMEVFRRLDAARNALLAQGRPQ